MSHPIGAWSRLSEPPPRLGHSARAGWRSGDPLLDQVGNTPLLELRQLIRSRQVRVFVKCEWFNPGGSVKDRPALNMILEGERQGLLTAGKTILDATSGNTGIAYALIAARRGYRVQLAIPGNASRERLEILRSYGVQLILTDPLEGSDGAIEAAREYFRRHPERYFYPDQYANPANWRAHYRSTGPEILRQTKGLLTHFVAGLGTTGTFTGVARFLKERNSSIQCLGMIPASPLHGLEGLKHLPSTLHVPPIWDEALADGRLEVETEAAQETARRLAREEGLLVGPSGGAAVAAALQVARGLERGVVVTLLPDGGMKYLSERIS